MDVAVRHGTADLSTYRDAPNKPICAPHADVAENLAGTLTAATCAQASIGMSTESYAKDEGWPWEYFACPDD
jgi:hypothetical protein